MFVVKDSFNVVTLLSHSDFFKCWAEQDKNKTVYHNGASTVIFQTIMIRSLMNKLSHE